MADGADHRFDIAGLDALFERLANAGFKVGPAQRTRAATLVTEFIARDRLPLEALDLARWLQPIFVTRPEERQHFLDTVIAWAKAAHRVEVVEGERPSAPIEDHWRDEPATRPRLRVPLLARVPRAAWAIIAGVALIGALAAVPQVRQGTIGLWERLVAESRPTPKPVPVPKQDQGAKPVDTSVSDGKSKDTASPSDDTTAATKSDLTQIATTITERAAQYGYAPTLEELYSANDASAVEGAASAPLPGDAQSIGERLGLATDRPLPLQREDFVTRLLLAIAPDASANAAMPGEGPFAEAVRSITSAEHASTELLPLLGADDVVLVGHTDTVRSVAFSPDGKRVLTGSYDKTAKLWDAETGRELRTFGHKVDVYSVAFSPDGKRVLTGTQDGNANLWDAETGRALRTFSGHNSVVASVAFSPDGKRVLTGSYDETAKMRDAETGGEVSTFAGFAGGVLSVAISPDGKRVLIGSYNKTAKLWDTETAREVRTFTSRGEVNSVGFSPDGKRVLIGSSDATAKLWDIESGREVRAFAGHTSGVYAAAISPDGKRVLTGSFDKTAKLWDAETGRELRTFDGDAGTGRVLESVGSFEGGVISAAFSPDGKRVLLGRLLKTNNAAIIHIAPNPIADAMQTHALTKAQLAKRVRAQLGLKEYSGEQPVVKIAPDTQTPVAAQPIDPATLNISDDDIARAWALASFDTGWPLNISDPPWRTHNARKVDPLTPVKDNASWVAAGVIALGAIALWFWAAFNARGFLARRQPEDGGRVADLAAEDRSRAERADQSMRIAARRMLERREGIRQLDLRASVDATARAGGFFTPISRASRRIPEYLFLIDSRSRFDHEAKRALDYIERLRAENVKADFYYFERAPDYVREDIGAPLVPIETITSQYATRRLIIVGDAATMLEGKGVGRWGDTIKVWEDRALMTTIPPAEWGGEEETVANALGVLVRPLSASALADLPGEMRQEGGEVQKQIAAAHGLSERPLPAALRETPYLWLLEAAPAEAQIDAMMGELQAYLGQQAFRWLAACAVYPAIDWDLTMALGWRLKTGELGLERPLANETRIALISELPWLRAGVMPQWLRERLIDEMDPHDRQTVRAFLGELMDAARHRVRAPRASISLSFSVEGGRGRAAFDDDTFVQFLLENPRGRDTHALEATKKVRDLLLPPLAARLFRPPELAILLGGAVLAVAAYWAAPRFTDAPLPTGAWAPLVALLLAPLLIWSARAQLPRLGAAIANFAVDPLAVWREARARSAARNKLKETDRLAYLTVTAPNTRRFAEGAAALLISLFVSAISLLPLLSMLVFVDISPGPLGIFGHAAEWRSSLRASLSDTQFGLLFLFALVLCAILLVSTIVASLRLGRLFSTWLAGEAAPLRASPGMSGEGSARVLTIAAILVSLVFAAKIFSSFGGSLLLPFAGAGLFSVFLYASLGLAWFWMARRREAILRLQLGLPEHVTTLKTELTVFASPRLRALFVRTFRRFGIRVVAATAANPVRTPVGAVLSDGVPVALSQSARMSLVEFSEDAFSGWRGATSDPVFRALFPRVIDAVRKCVLIELATVIQEPMEVPPPINIRRKQGAAPAPEAPPSAEGRRPFAFVDYANVDSDRVAPILAALREARIPIWDFNSEMRASEDFARLIEQNILESSAFIMFPSQSSLDSRWVAQEVALATRRWSETGERYLIVPLFLDEAAKGQMPDAIDSFQGYPTHVAQNGGAWILTPSGRDEVARLVRDLLRAFAEFEKDPLTGAAPPPPEPAPASEPPPTQAQTPPPPQAPPSEAPLA